MNYGVMKNGSYLEKHIEEKDMLKALEKVLNSKNKEELVKELMELAKYSVMAQEMLQDKFKKEIIKNIEE